MAFSGNWNLKLNTPMGERPVSLTIEEADGALEGSLSSDQGQTTVSGKADGDAIEFKGTLQGPMGAIELTFTGDVKGNEASGSVQFGSFGSGSWAGSRD